MAAVQELIEETKFDEAIKAAVKFLTDFEGTQVAERNAGILEHIQQEKTAFQENQDKFLSERVVKEWKKVRSKLLRKYSNRKIKLADARKQTASMDTEIKQTLAEKYTVTPEKIEEYWTKRKKRAGSSPPVTFLRASR